jgi:hypothetical protein
MYHFGPGFPPRLSARQSVQKDNSASITPPSSFHQARGLELDPTALNGLAAAPDPLAEFLVFDLARRGEAGQALQAAE